ncbi:MAG: hypothetical protein JSV91_08580 [Phycisphaerales bacterium]|nr:MAG: hypothetical protein JSV91_08580 [Phycisphaerales bacterium]
MSRNSIITSRAVIAVTVVSACLSSAADLAKPEGDDPVFLKKIRETRVVDVIKPPEDEFAMPQQEPGLVLTFGVKLPDGARLTTVAEPKSIRARDSAGRDLVKLPKPRFGDLQYVEMGMSFGDEPVEEFSLRLAVSDRSADTFDLDTVLEASFFQTTETVSFPLAREWATLDQGWFGGRTVRARLGEGFMGSGVEFSPVSARDLIENVELQIDGEWTDDSGWASDSQTITFMFDGEIKAGAKVRLTVRQGFGTTALTIDLKKQPLP